MNLFFLKNWDGEEKGQKIEQTLQTYLLKKQVIKMNTPSKNMCPILSN